MRPATTANELSTFEGDCRTLVRRDVRILRQEVRRRYHFETSFFQLSQCRLVSRIRSNNARPQCCKVTTGCPLLAVLDDSFRAATENWFHRESALFQGSEQIRLLLHARLALLPQEYRQPIRPDEVGRINDA